VKTRNVESIKIVLGRGDYMIVENTAKVIAESIKKANPDQTASLEVLEFSLKIIINALAVILLSIGFSLVLGTLKTTCLAMIAFALMRSITGGYHIKSSDLCVLVSSILVLIITLISKVEYIEYFNFFSIVILIIFAPMDMQIQSNIPEKYNLYLKIISIALVTLNMTFIKSDILSAAFFVQCLTLIKFKKRRLVK
jgi:accessory gene regulator B